MVRFIIIALVLFIKLSQESENNPDQIIPVPVEENDFRDSTFGQSFVIRSIPPVSKPDSSTSDKLESEQNFIIEPEDSEDDNFNKLIKQIPDSFSVNEISGAYELYEDDYILTSADIMRKRSILYRLLSNIYSLFDTFDYEGFRIFLQNTPEALNHQSLRYNLVDNLVERSIKSKNESTKQSLARFIEMIDVACISRTVGQNEHDAFNAFEKNIKSEDKKYSEIIRNLIEKFFVNEWKRLFPLIVSFSSNNYETAKEIIEGSNHSIWVSMKDFLFLLDRPSSEYRYEFMKWIIFNGHFNAHERYGKDEVTPLMLASMNANSSNDIVKAILELAPSTINETNRFDQKAYFYAKENHLLNKKFRKPLIKILKLENPTSEELEVFTI